MKANLSTFFKILSYIVFAIVALWGTYLSFIIVEIAFGHQAAFIGLFFFPIMFCLAPWYALIEWGYTFPLLISYGGMAIYGLLSYLSDRAKTK